MDETNVKGSPKSSLDLSNFDSFKNINSVRKKTPITSLLLLLKQSSRKSGLLVFKSFESLVLGVFLRTLQKARVFLSTLNSKPYFKIIEQEEKSNKGFFTSIAPIL
jgi:hypothetical protein